MIVTILVATSSNADHRKALEVYDHLRDLCMNPCFVSMDRELGPILMNRAIAEGKFEGRSTALPVVLVSPGSFRYDSKREMWWAGGAGTIEEARQVLRKA